MKLMKSPAGAYLVCLPKAIVESMDWTQGMNLEVRTLGKDRLELRPKEEVEEAKE